MEYKEFNNEIKDKLLKIGLIEEQSKITKLFDYMQILLEWNTKMNLTAITEEKEIIQKHFIDSLTIANYCSIGRIIDVGTGAGFPGIPIKIWNQDTEITLLDSLNKRVLFLKEIIKRLELKEINAIHGRAEEIAIKEQFREKYDIAVSRAVAPMNILLEYMLPFVKIGGKCICMKGPNIEELENSKKALEILGGKIIKIEELNLPETEIKRNIIIIEKEKKTPKQYPRKAGKPSREPLI